MATNISTPPEISTALIDGIRSFPVVRSVEHCGGEFTVSPFDYYGTCPHCGKRIKLRAFSGQPELGDLFDAVFEWLNQPGAEAAYRNRLAQLQAEEEDQ